MSDMRAVGFTEFGDPDVLGIVTVPRPSPGPGQVLVKVAAATVNPTDLGFRQGGRPLPAGVEPPYIPGMDLAGVIEEAGPDTPPGTRATRVMAAVAPMVPGGGAQAEYRVVDEDQLARGARRVVADRGGDAADERPDGAHRARHARAARRGRRWP